MKLEHVHSLNTPSSALGTSSPLRGKGTRGFTLIELLVGVLIIGILAAVALPQYQVVRDKAEVVRALPVLKTFKNMQELYRMTNGEYATSLYDLDIDQLGDCSVISATVMLCGPHKERCIMNRPNASLEYPLRSGAALQQYYANAGSGRQNWVRCGGATTARVERLCKALGADENTQSTNTNGRVFWRVPL